MSNPVVDSTYRLAKRVVITVVGVTLLVFGGIMLITPGPGIVTIAAALGVLAVEYAWARVWLQRVRQKISAAGQAARSRAADKHR